VVDFQLRRLSPEESAAKAKARAELDALRFADRKSQAAIEDEKRRLARVQSSVVYLIQSAGVHKIGFTTSIDCRMKTIQSMCPVPVTVIETAPGGRLQEKMLHHMYRHHHSHGEWFKLTDDDITEAVAFMRTFKHTAEARRQYAKKGTL
jgi:hypothetical protein